MSAFADRFELRCATKATDALVYKICPCLHIEALVPWDLFKKFFVYLFKLYVTCKRLNNNLSRLLQIFFMLFHYEKFGYGKIGIKCFSRFLLVAHGRKPSNPHFHGPIRRRISEEDRRNV